MSSTATPELNSRPASMQVPAGPSRGTWWFAALTWAAVLLVPCVSIVLHELGHFTMHALFGYERNRLTFATTERSGGPSPGVDPVMADGVSFAAGTIVSLLLVAGALIWMAKRGPNRVAFAVLMFACIRALVSLLMEIKSVGMQRALLGGFGELRYGSRAFGGPPAVEAVISWLEFALPFAAFVYAVRRFPLTTKLRTFSVILVTLTLGLALWIGVVGPRLLPA